MLLCGDIGGTKSILARFDRGHPFEAISLERYSSPESPGLDAILARYLARVPGPVEAVCLGVPGPVIGMHVDTTNLPWDIDGEALRAQVGGVPLFLLNDLEAVAAAVPQLPPAASAVVKEGKAAVGNIAIAAAGTGLGEAGLVWDGHRHVPFASEGGHADFAPRSPRQARLLEHLRARFGHVSWERVVCGPGLVNVFEFLRDVEKAPVPADFAAAFASAADPAAVISVAALAGAPPIACDALGVFLEVYGAEAGNLALKLKATGGVFLAGGIAPKILPKLQDGTFARAFIDKGRFEWLLADIPVRAILDERTGLYGAACHADAQLG